MSTEPALFSPSPLPLRLPYSRSSQITIPSSLKRLDASFLAVCDWGIGGGVGGRGGDREVRYLAVFSFLVRSLCGGGASGERSRAAVSVSSLPRGEPAWHRTRGWEMGGGESEECGAPARDPRSFYCIPRWSDGLRSGGLKGMDELRATQ
jgi:hypothetical protein